MAKHLTQTMTAHDRCDTKGCNARAYIRATLQAGELLFCAHHGAQHKGALLPRVLMWQDETYRLAEQRSCDD